MPGLLSGLLLLPLIGAALILAFRDESEANLRNIRSIALWTTIVTFAVSIVAWTRFDPSSASFQLLEEYGWISDSIKVSAWR